MVSVEPELYEWLQDRASILGVPYTSMCRDVLALWASLLQEEEQCALVEWGTAPLNVDQRDDAYIKDLLPAGRSKSHLNDAPLGVEELQHG